MQFVGNGKLIDIACQNKNCINFVTEAVVFIIVIMILKFIVFYTILQVPYTREN